MTISPSMGLKVQTFLTLPNLLLTFRLFKKFFFGGGFTVILGYQGGAGTIIPPPTQASSRTTIFDLLV